MLPVPPERPPDTGSACSSYLLSLLPTLALLRCRCTARLEISVSDSRSSANRRRSQVTWHLALDDCEGISLMMQAGM